MTEGSIMLMNTSEESNDTGIYRLPTDLKSVKSYSVFEGQIIILSGYTDNNFSQPKFIAN
jgi:hypothetical protein